jgi:hypothetical protein
VIINPASVISRAMYERIGGFRQHIYTEDYDLWLRALAHGGRHILVPQVLVRYRVGPSQKSASASRAYDAAAESLMSIARSGELDGRLIRLAAASARRHSRLARRVVAVAKRASCEERLCSGDLRSARSGVVGARLAYSSTVKFAVGLSVVMLSPRLYASILRRRAQ